MNLDEGAGLLHRLTSYTPEREWDVPADDPRVRHDLVSNDWETIPPPVKVYPEGLAVTPLPRDLPRVDVSAAAVLAGAGVEAAVLDAAQLGRVLFLGAGVVRTSDRRGVTFLYRASGSAGARFPMEVYASTRGVVGVPDGVHWYDPVAHALVWVGPAAGGEATTLVVTGIPWRTGWRYAERGFRHIYWDSGTLLSQLYAASAAVGFEPRLWTEFPDREITDLVGADGVHEFPVALLSFGSGVPATAPGGEAAAGMLPEVEFPLCTRAQRAGDRDEVGVPLPAGAVLGEVPESLAIDATLRKRGSQRLMDRSATVPRELLEWPMAAAMRGVDVPHWVVVHGVDGVEPGIYRWPDLDTPIRGGDLRDELARICLDQMLGGDAAYVVISAVPGGGVDDRGYRRAQLLAGLVEGRLHIAAYALGATATGMTFLDSEIPELLGEADDLVTLLFTCVGVGAYRSRSGGGPGEPVTIRPVASKLVGE
jgi:SagB-type dehydrogenase family enzyme